MDIKNRISAALEDVLSELYEESGVNNGDISPLDFLAWEEITAAAAELFKRLIEQNKPL